jgi:hypothetical protein
MTRVHIRAEHELGGEAETVKAGACLRRAGFAPALKSKSSPTRMNVR